ncbi:MAG: hypothetical protein AB7G93_09650 [Bdellovibrionales bacterium]
MKPCNECPFVKASPLDGSPDWLRDVFEFSRKDEYFYHTCHKTDPNADGFVGGKKKRECAGHLQMMFNEMEGTPGEGGVYESIDALIYTYLQHWLGDEELNKIKREARLKR